MELSFFCFLLLTVQTNLSLLINARHRHKLHFQQAHLLLHKPVFFVTQGKPESICFWAFSAQPCVFVCVFCALFCSSTAYPSDTVKACVHFFFYLYGLWYPLLPGPPTAERSSPCCHSEQHDAAATAFTQTQIMYKNTHIQMHSVKPEHNFAKVIFGVQLLRPTALCDDGSVCGEGGWKWPTSINKQSLSPGVERTRRASVCGSNGSVVNIRAGPWSQINDSSVITQEAESNYLNPINIIKRSLLSDGVKRNTAVNQACAHKKLNQSWS